jgi:hypothetical protein
MAHFAQLDNTNTVIQVIVVSNDIINNAQGLDGEAAGIAFCQDFYGVDTVWKQTSYNGNFRKNFAGVGMTYDPIRDAFIGEKPTEDENAWIFNEDTLRWNLNTNL